MTPYQKPSETFQTYISVYRPALSIYIRICMSLVLLTLVLKKQKSKKLRRSILISYLFTICISQHFQPSSLSSAIRLPVTPNCSGGIILSQIFFPICITTQLVPKQAELFRIQRFSADVSNHLVSFKVIVTAVLILYLYYSTRTLGYLSTNTL